jgi:hypothetical protein
MTSLRKPKPTKGCSANGRRTYNICLNVLSNDYLDPPDSSSLVSAITARHVTIRTQLNIFTFDRPADVNATL